MNLVVIFLERSIFIKKTLEMVRAYTCNRLHFRDQKIIHKFSTGQFKCQSLQSCPALCDPMDHSPPSSSVLGILWARGLEWVAISFSRDLPNPGVEVGSPCRQSLYHLSHQGWPGNLRQGIKSCEAHMRILFQCSRFPCTLNEVYHPCFSLCNVAVVPLITDATRNTLQISKCPSWVELPLLRSTSLNVGDNLRYLHIYIYFFFFLQNLSKSPE